MPDSLRAAACGLPAGASLMAVARVADLGLHAIPAFVLPDADEVRIARLVKAEDRADRRAAWGLARWLSGMALGLAPADVPVARSAGGRPNLPDGCGFDFNLSHSSGVVAVGLARGGAIGVDVERARSLDLWTRLASDFMDAEDIARWSALPDEARAAAALAQWCGKEAVLKATGEGLTADPRMVKPPPGGGFVARAGRHLRTGAGTLPDAAYAFAVEGAPPHLFLASAAGWMEP